MVLDRCWFILIETQVYSLFVHAAEHHLGKASKPRRSLKRWILIDKHLLLCGYVQTRISSTTARNSVIFPTSSVAFLIYPIQDLANNSREHRDNSDEKLDDKVVAAIVEFASGVTFLFVSTSAIFSAVAETIQPYYWKSCYEPLDQGFSGPRGGNGGVLRGPRAEAFTK